VKTGSRELIILWAGRHRRDDWHRLCEGYRERTGRWVELRELAVRVRGGSEGRERLRAEGQALLSAVPDPAWTVALDRRGKARSSLDLARWLERKLDDWPHPLVFLVGSDLGLDRAVLDSARERLSLGPMTLPHELARLVLHEQIYRALSVLAGIKYHREPL
jgi:23S rRNA (pseudouridine1915-N3)-methyltransferase